MELHCKEEKNNDAPNMLLSSLSSSQSCTIVRKKNNHPLGVVIVLFAKLCYSNKKITTHPTCLHNPLHRVALQEKKMMMPSALSSSLWSCAIASKKKSTIPSHEVVFKKTDGSNTWWRQHVGEKKGQKEAYFQARAPPLFIVLKVILSSRNSHSSNSTNSKWVKLKP